MASLGAVSVAALAAYLAGINVLVILVTAGLVVTPADSRATLAGSASWSKIGTNRPERMGNATRSRRSGT